jgi:hypothetical protein
VLYIALILASSEAFVVIYEKNGAKRGQTSLRRPDSCNEGPVGSEFTPCSADSKKKPSLGIQEIILQIAKKALGHGKQYLPGTVQRRVFDHISTAEAPWASGIYYPGIYYPLQMQIDSVKDLSGAYVPAQKKN